MLPPAGLEYLERVTTRLQGKVWLCELTKPKLKIRPKFVCQSLYSESSTYISSLNQGGICKASLKYIYFEEKSPIIHKYG